MGQGISNGGRRCTSDAAMNRLWPATSHTQRAPVPCRPTRRAAPPTNERTAASRAHAPCLDDPAREGGGQIALMRNRGCGASIMRRIRIRRHRIRIHGRQVAVARAGSAIEGNLSDNLVGKSEAAWTRKDRTVSVGKQQHRRKRGSARTRATDVEPDCHAIAPQAAARASGGAVVRIHFAYIPVVGEGAASDRVFFASSYTRGQSAPTGDGGNFETGAA
jgi:hypothetical protein